MDPYLEYSTPFGLLSRQPVAAEPAGTSSSLSHRVAGSRNSEYKRTGNARRLVVAGCLVERYRRELQAEIPDIDAVFGTGEIESIIDHCEGTGSVAPAGSGHDYLYHDLTPRRRATPRHFAYVKINEGCDHPYSFCVIPQLRGGFRSRHFESIISEARRLFGEGVRELTLIGQDTTAYGEDLGVRNGLPGAHELLGYDLLEVGRAEDAIPHLQTALQEQPANEQVEAWLGRAYLSAGRPRDAVPHLESAASAAPSNTQLVYLLAKAYAQLAARTQAQLLAADPDSVYARLAVAEDHEVNGRAGEALVAYRKALEADPGLLAAWRAVGDLERDSGGTQAAAAAYERALELDPGSVDLRLSLGQALLSLGLAELALEHLQRAASAATPPRGALEALGKAYMDLDRPSEAIDVLLRALAEADEAEERMRVHYWLAQGYRKVDRAAKARAHLQKFAALRAEFTARDQ